MIKKRIILVIFTMLLLVLTPFLTSLSASDSSIYNNYETHVIKNVPYAGQKEIIYCEYAAVEMVLKYYGINLTQPEILYHVGVGYSLGYKPPLKTAFSSPRIKFPHKFRFWSDETAGGTDDYKFLAQLYGLTFNNIYPTLVINHRKCWNEYWGQAKNYIKKDVPVITGVDPLAWPPYKEILNLSINLPKILAGTHVVVIVGFNETNQTVCVNDPCTGFFNVTEKGIYRWINLNDFRKAVGRTNWEIKEYRYELLVFENTSDEPLPKDTILDLVHQKNIKKMEGIKSAYDEEFINERFCEFGINALKALKEDFDTKFIRWIPFHKISTKSNFLYAINDPIIRLIKNSNFESKNKNYVSQYLKQNVNLSSNYEKDIILLEKESKCWKNLSILSKELYETITYNNTILAMKLSKPIINKMVNILENIICIENMIIDGPTENFDL